MAKKKPASVSVEAHKHVADKRPNIPTRETAAFAKENGAQPFVAHRDRSLDPQLVWKSKDEQDAKPLEVMTVPIHVQEKIHPQAIIEAVEAWGKEGKPVADLFADFNGLDDFAMKLEFYQHDQHWTNRLILGDSLFVMASLAEKERLRGQVQCIYFDPPYGIRFGSNWQVSTRKRDVKDAKAEDLTRQPEQIKAFRDTWELGIHSYLTYLRDRLGAARDQLTETGSIFVQIGDENVHLVRCLLDEVFRSENFVAQINFKKTVLRLMTFCRRGSITFCGMRETGNTPSFGPFTRSAFLGSAGTEEYQFIENPDATTRYATREELAGITPLPAGARAYRPTTMTSSHHYALGEGSYVFHGRTFSPGTRFWSTSPDGMKKCEWAGRLIARKQELAYKRYLEDFPVMPLNTSWPDTMMSSRGEEKMYVVQSSTKVISRCVLMSTEPGDLVLDPTCGSGTTAYVAEQWGRRWITIDTSRVALALPAPG